MARRLFWPYVLAAAVLAAAAGTFLFVAGLAREHSDLQKQYMLGLGGLGAGTGTLVAMGVLASRLWARRRAG